MRKQINRILYLLSNCFSYGVFRYTAIILLLFLSASLSLLILRHTALWKLLNDSSIFYSLGGLMCGMFLALTIFIVVYSILKVINLQLIKPRVFSYLCNFKNSYLLNFHSDLKKKIPFSDDEVVDVFQKYISNLLDIPISKILYFKETNGHFCIHPDCSKPLVENLMTDKGLPKWLIETKSPFFFSSSITAKTQTDLDDILNDLGKINARLYIPIAHKNRMEGILCIYGVSYLKACSLKNMFISKNLAEQTAILISNKTSLWNTFSQTLMND